MRISIWDTRGTVFLFFLAILTTILILNDGRFIYTLDDPYIHLALSEQIWNGGYGVNGGEFAAPSSSIAFPLILVPFAPFRIHEFVPLVLNVVFLFVTIEVLRLFFLRIGFGEKHETLNIAYVFIAVSALTFNLIGLAFSGMEHSIHVAITAATILGLVIFLEDDRPELWFICCIVLGPLFRYEALSLSLACIVIFALRGWWKTAAAMAAFIVISVGGFSIFLVAHGLPWLPSSVLSKSAVANSALAGSLAQKFYALQANISSSLSLPNGFLLTFTGLVALIPFCQRWRERAAKPDALILIALVMLTLGHCVAGRYGWFYRYEIYAMVGTSMLLTYLARKYICSMCDTKSGWTTVLSVGLVAMGFVGLNNIYATAQVPIASNNIYEQQYQMHRFLTEFYRAPAAVNDLGWTTYRNSNYVLDLWGLGSDQARKILESRDIAGLQRMVREKDVRFAMIYSSWFYGLIPATWRRIGQLHLSRADVTPARATVDFFAVDPNSSDEIRQNLELFRQTLPARVKLDIF